MNIGVVFGLPAAFRSRGLRSDILRGGLGSLLLKSLNMLLGFSLSVVLARVLGADG